MMSKSYVTKYFKLKTGFVKCEKNRVKDILDRTVIYIKNISDPQLLISFKVRNYNITSE